MKTVVLTLMFGAFGLFFLGAGIVMVVRRRRLIATAVRTEGKIVAYEESEFKDDDGSSTYAYYPIVEFKDAKGMQRRVKSSEGSAPDGVGTTVTLVYDPANPVNAELEAVSRSSLGPILVIGAGTLFLVIAIGVWAFNVPVR